ncbi:MAG TPA: hypothetical protein PKV75_08680 [Desulfobacterales bacterium]|nr:hypothetical protein [Desulfobacterales bacterium]
MDSNAPFGIKLARLNPLSRRNDRVGYRASFAVPSLADKMSWDTPALGPDPLVEPGVQSLTQEMYSCV